MNEKKIVENVDAYINFFPLEVKAKLQKIRVMIKDICPDVEEVISYQMPTFKLRGKNLIHFAAYTNHIGLYPAPNCLESLSKELSFYKTSKGTIQFPLNEELPYDLILKIIECRVKELTSNFKK